MNKWLFPAVTALVVLQGCSSVPRGNIPVVDSSTRVSNSERVTAKRQAPGINAGTPQAQTLPEDSGVTVMIPQGAGASGIQTFPAGNGAAPISTTPITTEPVNAQPITTDPNPIADEPFDIASMNSASAPKASSAPTGIPRSGAGGGLSADEQLDGPVLALLTTAQTQQGSGDFNGAASSLERAQRIAPREPQVLYRLAQVRLSQGDAPQAEQLARRALTYANGRPSLQAELWNTIAQAREKQGDSAGAAQARQKARVSS
ncbi:tetratricopeptide repeat protein [Pseudomonas putida]|uniref:tetratricopeptide repeat protein n=1 Tax=Pseudomonas TaxID=286 RepID=UPI000997339D|nr:MULTISPECIES: tetratricopeptide repeat protein [Pseudomonas]MBF8651405.1 tetratricopeptide repeat protein [Pseudomonas putida]MBF8655473.1 tetratricopeptide repeat protein [Pseudomonas putida]MBF8659695.1 tetratricopeptide repeat protein [Pseudomonas putida]MBF8678672.1 tetratricopeptide repeat protein [Pseudomonas fulva]MBF8717083.1 tetratricopeptide repeat protein [Pseudomonas fulva]